MSKGDLVLRVRDVHKSYRRRPVLRGASLELHAGTLTGIVGENGSGKSTLLRILANELAQDSGTVECLAKVGYCPQNSVLHGALTVDQHLRYFQVAYGLDDLGRASQLLELLHFAPYRQARLGTLSGGTRQKLNLTLALMHDPGVLLLDEPYQGLDWETYLRFWDLAAALRDRGRSVLVVSHLAYDTKRLDAVYQLEGGILKQAARAEAHAGGV